MSTNGCVNLRGGSSGGNSNVCSDYTPQSLPYRNYTLYPLWTDLIRGTASGGQTSKMLFKAFDDYVLSINRGARRAYAASDDFFKILAFLSERRKFKDMIDEIKGSDDLKLRVLRDFAKTLKTKSQDFSNLGFFVPNFVVTRLGVEPRTY